MYADPSTHVWTSAPWLDDHSMMQMPVALPSWPSDDAMLGDFMSPTLAPPPSSLLHPAVVHPSGAQKCGYRTGKCFNLRVLKRNGTYHKLCDHHRERANWNQKKLDRKKRLRRDSNVLFPSNDSSNDSDDDHTIPSNSSPTAFALDLDDPMVFGFDEAQFFCELMATHHSHGTNASLAVDQGEHISDATGEASPPPCQDAEGASPSMAAKAPVVVPDALGHDEVLHFVQALLV